MEYVEVKELSSGHHFILAAARVPHYFKDPEEYEIVCQIFRVYLWKANAISPFSLILQIGLSKRHFA